MGNANDYLLKRINAANYAMTWLFNFRKTELMKTGTKRILVPTDFTKVVDFALQHAMRMAQVMGAEVHVLHLWQDKDDMEVAQRRLDAETARAGQMDAGVPVKGILREGKVYEGIGAVAEDIGASFIVMGTHGMRGMQFITGSRALRVVSNSKVPFIVVQEKDMGPDGYKNIVVPLDLKEETRRKIGLVADMAAYFKGKAHVIVPKETDEGFKRQLNDNIVFAKKYFGERGVAMEAIVSEAGSGNFVDAVLAYSAKIDADLIAMMNSTEGNIFGVLGVPYEQEIITNKALIPVMMVHMSDNPNEVSGGWSFQ